MNHMMNNKESVVKKIEHMICMVHTNLEPSSYLDSAGAFFLAQVIEKVGSARRDILSRVRQVVY